jgi:hypothetical protein
MVESTNPRFVYGQWFTDDAHTFTQEVRLISNTADNSRFDYVLGVFYEKQTRHGNWYTSTPGSYELRADTGAADRHDTDPFIYPVSEPVPQFGPAAECIGMLADDVAGEIEMFRNPVAHVRQVLAERQRDDVFGIADEEAGEFA